MAEDEIMELLWQNGQVVMQSQRSMKRFSASGFSDEMIAANRRDVEDPSSHRHHNQQSPFMQDDEMASWLFNDTPYDFCPDLLYSSTSPCANSAAASATATATATMTVTATNVTAAASAAVAPHALFHRQLVQGPRPPTLPSMEIMENFGHLSRMSRGREDEAGPSHSTVAVNELTVVDSSDTPAWRPQSGVSDAVHCDPSRWTVDERAQAALATSPAGGGETAACEATVTSSPSGSSASAEPPSQKPPPFPPPEDRKRKAREADDADCQSEDVDIESADAKKHARGSTSTKRSRAAEVHNLSERRRRDRINEKMRALQELIPHCNKADKASMLDEAIEYLKSLQLQVQMMSMGCSMVPMMFPGVPRYMPHMGMGIGMGMGMDIGMNRPMMPFPNVLASSPLPAPGSTAHLGPRFPMPAFPMQHVDPSRGGVGPSHQPGPMPSSLMMQNSRQHQIPNLVDPYQQYLGLHHLQMQPQQNQNQATQHGMSKPSSCKGAENQSPRPAMNYFFDSIMDPYIRKGFEKRKSGCPASTGWLK